MATLITDLQPAAEGELGDETKDPPPAGSGDTDDHVLIDSDGDLCNGKPETGNQKLHARFGCRQSHNEELCVASCGTIYGRQRFYGSEAPNGVRVSSFIVMPRIICVLQLHRHS